MIRDTCKCGSAFQYESRANFSEDVHRQEMDALAKWLKAHDVEMQNILMKFDPATGEERPYPSHAAQWRNWHGVAAWLFDPWTGKRRNAYDVGSDVHGLLIVPAGTLGGDTGCGASKQNKHEAMVCAQRPPTPVGWGDADWIKHLQEQPRPVRHNQTEQEE